MMNLNATLFGQMLTFAVFIWFTMKYVWPPLTKVMEERKIKIADGLAASEQGMRQLELAKHKAAETLRDAKIQAAQIIDEANKRKGIIIEEAKNDARQESARLLELGKAELEKEKEKAKQQMKTQIALIAMSGAEKILKHNIDSAKNQDLLKELITEI